MSELRVIAPAGTARRHRASWISTGSWLGPAVVMLLAGLYRITTPELWRDEIASWSAATRSLPRLFAMLGNLDASNGAYYLLLHGWTALFGDSVLSLRLPSALAMAGAAAFTSLIARQCFGGRVAALAAGLLLVTIPNACYYAQEIRSYAIVTCAVAAATWFLFRALERPALGRWAWYCAATAVAATLHLVSLSAVGAQLLVVGLHWWRSRAWRVLWQYPLAVLAAVVPAVPVIVLGRRQLGRQLGWLWRPSLYELRFFWQGLFGSYQVLYALLALAAVALLLRRGRRRLAAVQLLLLAGLPVIEVWVLSQGGTSYFVDRYLLFTLPACAALAGGGVGALYAGLRRLRLRGRTVAALVVLAAVSVPGALGLAAQRQSRYVTAHTEMDYLGAARLIARGYRPGDGLAAIADPANWAMVGPGVTYYLPARVRPQPLFIARTAVQADDLYPVSCPVAADCLGNAPRVWLVTIGTGGDPYENLPADQVRVLRAGFTPTEVRNVRGLTVSLLVRARR